jgi:hypothetical protein
MGVLGGYMSTPGKEHWTTIKRVFMYFCCTKYYDICYQGKLEVDREAEVHGFVDTRWDGHLGQQRLTSRYVLKMFDGAISWMSNRRPVVALSTTEVEYMETIHGRK